MPITGYILQRGRDEIEIPGALSDQAAIRYVEEHLTVNREYPPPSERIWRVERTEIHRKRKGK